MKKPSREKNDDAIHIENRHPGCVWGGLLHVLNHNYHWRDVKKRLPLRRSGSPKHTNGNSGNGKANSQNQNQLQGDNNVVHRKKTPFLPASKSSIISKLKSLVGEDKSRTKGKTQHRRSSNSSSTLPTEIKESAAVVTNISQQLTDDGSKTARSRRHRVDEGFCESNDFIDALSLTILRVSKDNESREKYDDAIPDTFAPVVAPQIKVNDEAITQWKNINEKFEHLKRLDNIKEKPHIAMDGVLDKIPQDREGVSNETKSEMFEKWVEKNRGRRKKVRHGKNGCRYFKRTASLDDSNMGRYCQLFESCNKETKPNDMNILKPEEQDTPLCLPDKRSLNRILSLPDFESCFQSENSDHNSTDLDEIFTEVNLGLTFQSQLDTHIEDEQNYEEQQPSSTDVTEPTMELSTVDAFHLNSEGLGDSDKHESLAISEDQESECFVHRFQVRHKDLDVFNYVRDVLELSGFSRYEVLAMKHADDQPVDPMVFDEVKFECPPLTDPKCYIGSENHLFCIFDTINEVLIQICQRSVTYWPVPVTRHCHVHPMPFGHHLLEHVWDNISSYLVSTYHLTLNEFVCRDMFRDDGWMNLQFESECVGLEVGYMMFEELVEDLIFDDLLVELIGT